MTARAYRPRLGRSLAAVLATFVAATNSHAADLAGHAEPPLPRPVYRAPLYYAPLAEDPGPASYQGYYGYYGYDILGVPYNGLYSANVTCLRSVRTPEGYRTVYVC